MQTGPDVLRFEEWIILEDFRFGHAGTEQIEHIFDPQAITPDTGPPPALLRVKGDSAEIAHGVTLLANGDQREPVFHASIIFPRYKIMPNKNT